ncbi:hypothetical protein RHGRI_004729 [Rhododendron griersonianum]|uniref:Uncharacterized protein n=1 Tax=Rhododendron griersonianum TaxID=479676 RepID=A0AAV6LBU7_9ERIC|nr:hypothetical protein RHGRI_004729 [Rhododendron griersonianum]
MPRKRNAGDSAGTVGEDEDDSLVLRDGHDRTPRKRNAGEVIVWKERIWVRQGEGFLVEQDDGDEGIYGGRIGGGIFGIEGEIFGIGLLLLRFHPKIRFLYIYIYIYIYNIYIKSKGNFGTKNELRMET